MLNRLRPSLTVDDDNGVIHAYGTEIDVGMDVSEMEDDELLQHLHLLDRVCLRAEHRTGRTVTDDLFLPFILAIAVVSVVTTTSGTPWIMYLFFGVAVIPYFGFMLWQLWRHRRTTTVYLRAMTEHRGALAEAQRRDLDIGALLWWETRRR